MFSQLEHARMNLKDKLQTRKPVFGSWVSYRDPAIAETFAIAGFDFVAIDMEHTTISTDNANRIITACHSQGVPCFPRPVSHNNDFIKPLLEAGADGIFIQMVNSKEDVKKIISYFKFPPLGNRSYGVNRAHSYGFDFDRYITSWNKTSSLIVQVESIEAVENIESIIDFEEVDAVMIGPYDISGSLGVPGQLEHPLVQSACKKVVNACFKKNKSCCTQISNVSKGTVEKAFNDGFTFVILGSDLFVLTNWSKEINKLISKMRV